MRNSPQMHLLLAWHRARFSPLSKSGKNSGAFGSQSCAQPSLPHISCMEYTVVTSFKAINFNVHTYISQEFRPHFVKGICKLRGILPYEVPFMSVEVCGSKGLCWWIILQGHDQYLTCNRLYPHTNSTLP